VQALANGRQNAASPEAISGEAGLAAQTRANAAVDQFFACARAAGEGKVQFDRFLVEKKASQKQAEEKLAAIKKQAQEAEAEAKKASQIQANAENELALGIASAQRAAERANETQSAIPLAQAELKHSETELDTARRTGADGEKSIRVAEFSQDNVTLATTGDDFLVHTWSADTGEGFETLRHIPAPGGALAFRTALELICVSTDGACSGWSLRPDWTLQAAFGSADGASPVSDRVNALAFSPDGQTLAMGSGEPTRSGQIQLWSVTTGRLNREFNEVHSDAVFGLAFSRNGQYLASSAADRFMKVIDLRTGKVARAFEGHTHHVLGVAWKQDGRTLATAGADNVVKIWDFRTGERRKNIDGFEKEVTSISGFTEDRFLVTSGDHQVRIVNEKGETVRTLSNAKDFLYSAAGTTDGKRIIAGGQEGTLWVWDALSGELLDSFR
jgi:WD40 repeat protein